MAKASKAGAARRVDKRAARPQPAAPPRKILRMGIVLGEHIIEERLLRQAGNVTIGQAARNTFVVPSRSLPLVYPLMLYHQGSYILQFTDGMDGRLMIKGRVLTFDQVKQQGLAKKKGPFWRIKLPEDTKGKVVIGDVTILFQFVNAPPRRPKARLPAAIRGSIFANLDPRFASIVALVFLAHAGVGVAFSVMEVPEHISGSRFKRLAQVTIKRQVQKFRTHRQAMQADENAMGPGEAVAQKGQQQGGKGKSKRRGHGHSRVRGKGGEGGRGGPRVPRRLSEEEEAGLESAAASIAVATDAAKGAFRAVAIGAECHGPDCKGRVVAGRDALSQGAASTDLDSAAGTYGSAGSGGPGGPGVGRRGAGGRGRIGHGHGVGRGFRGPGRGAVAARPRIVTPMGPKPRLSAHVPRISNVPTSLAEKIRHRMKAKVYGLKRLYNTFLQSSKFRCSVKIGFMLNKNGHVSSVSVTGGCPGNFISAVKRKVSVWRLPAGGQGFFRISVTFTY